MITLTLQDGTNRFLPCYSPQIAEWLYRYVDPKEVLQFDDAYGTSWAHSYQHLSVPLFPPMPPIEIGTLYWPSDASRFAVAYMLVDDSDLAALNSSIYGLYGPNLITLSLDEQKDQPLLSTSGNSISVDMYPLPPRPLASCLNLTGQPVTLSDGTIVQPGSPVSNQLYLLTLVDARFFYWSIGVEVEGNSYGINPSGSNVSGSSTGITWNQWYQDIAQYLPDTFINSTPAAAYGGPSNRYTFRRQPIPLILDAAAYGTGLRICRHLTGELDAQNYTEAKAQDYLDQKNIMNGPNVTTDNYVPLAGSSFDATRLVQSISIPEAVQVVFGAEDDFGNFKDVPYVIDVELESLDLTEFVDESNTPIRGIPNTKKVIIADMEAMGDTPANLTALQAYAKQAATDYYRWQLGNADWVLSGIAAYDSNGLIDCIKWTYNTQMCCTRIQRRRWNDRSLGMFRKSTREGYLSAFPAYEGCDTLAPPASTLPGYIAPSSSGSGSITQFAILVNGCWRLVTPDICPC